MRKDKSQTETQTKYGGRGRGEKKGKIVGVQAMCLWERKKKIKRKR